MPSFSHFKKSVEKIECFNERRFYGIRADSGSPRTASFRMARFGFGKKVFSFFLEKLRKDDDGESFFENPAVDQSLILFE